MHDFLIDPINQPPEDTIALTFKSYLDAVGLGDIQEGVQLREMRRCFYAGVMATGGYGDEWRLELDQFGQDVLEGRK